MTEVSVIDSWGQPGSPAMPRRLTAPQIADDLTARIAAGEYGPGSRLPSYAELAILYSVSITTAQRVYVILKARGDVESEPGRGHFVPE